MIQGRPEVAAWLGRVRTTRPGIDAAMSVCGPRGLCDEARQAAAKASTGGNVVFVEEEVFKL